MISLMAKVSKPTQMNTLIQVISKGAKSRDSVNLSGIMETSTKGHFMRIRSKG